MSGRAARWLALAAALGMLVYCATHMRVVSDVSSFMPAGGSSELAALSSELTNSDLTRSMVISVGAAEIDRAAQAVRRLADALRAHPEIAWLREGANDAQLESIYELYFPRRHYFLSRDPTTELPQRLSDAGLQDAARRLRGELARPSAAIVARIAGDDPLLAFPALLERVNGGDRKLSLHDGIFVTRDREHAILLLGTRASPFESDRQRLLVDAIGRHFAEIRAELGDDLVLESAGVNRYALDVEDSIRSEIVGLFITSTLGVVVLFLAFFRSARALFIAVLPHAAGVLIAATAGLAVFGHLNGLAIAFGISLIGVSIDYSIHLLNHHALTPAGTSPDQTVRRLRSSLLLGGGTTIVSLAGLAFANFPGFYQMGVLATVGVGAALAVSLLVVPGLMGGLEAPPLTHRTASALGRRVLDLERVRPALFAVPLVCVALAAWGLSRIHWVDDFTELTTVSPAIQAEEARVRARIASAGSGRVLIARGDTVDAAIARNDALGRRLESLVARGALGGYRSLHTFLWSESLQRENRDALLADPTLPDRLDRVFSDAGFRPGAFAGFREDLEGSPPDPLRHADLADSPLWDLVRSMLIDLGDRAAVVTHLEGLHDPAAIDAAIEGLPQVAFFDQSRFFREVYGEYRERIVAVVVTGCFTVFGLLVLRYRRVRPALAAALPSLLVAGVLAAIAAALGVHTHILHLVGLILVMGMGVDYGIFMVDSPGGAEEVGATMLSLLLSCSTTIFIFGVMGFSEHPVLHAIGRTAGVGIALAFLFAPVSLVLVGGRDGAVGRALP